MLLRSQLPHKAADCTRLVVLSDSHEKHRQLGTLPAGDVLVHCGDVLWLSTLRTRQGTRKKYEDFNRW